MKEIRKPFNFLLSMLISLAVSVSIAFLMVLFPAAFFFIFLGVIFLLSNHVVFSKLRMYNLTSLLQIRKKLHNTYEINMNTISYIALIKICRLSPTMVYLQFRSEFKKALEIAAKRYNGENVKFETDTWLLREKDRELLKNHHFEITPYKENFFGRIYIYLEKKSLIVTAHIAFNKKDFLKVKKNLNSAKFYNITWNKETAESFINAKSSDTVSL